MNNNIDQEDRAIRMKDSKELEEIEAKNKLNAALLEKEIQKNNEEINRISTIHEINDSINTGEIPEIKKYSISYETFTRFIKSLFTLKSKVGEQAQSPFWRPILNGLHSIRNTALSTPCSFEATFFRDKLEELGKKKDECKETFSELLEFFKDTLNTLSLLIEENRNPIIEEIRKLNLHEDEYTVLIKVHPNLFDDTKNMLKNVFKKNPDIITEQDLLKTKTYGDLLLIGSTWNFPSYVFESPRSWRIHIISYDYGLQTLQKSKKFIMPYQEPKSYKFKPIPTDYSKDSEFKIDLTQVSKSYIGKFSKSEIVEDWPCRLALLTNDKMVYLSNLEGVDNAQDCLVEDDGGKIIVARRKVEEFQERDIVLLRAEHAGDIIIEEANNILGESGQNVEEIRKFQKKWKEDFKNLINEKGSGEILKLLKESGASENIRSISLTSWTRDNYRVIGPRKVENFKAILSLLGKKENFEKSLKINQDIRGAHIEAGGKLRKKLLEFISVSDITQLRASGFQEFKIPETGSFEAYRIEDIDDKEYFVPRTEQDKPISISKI